MAILTLIGIVCGAVCAVAHSACYLSTRSFLTIPGRSSYQLISLGHVYMGILSLAALPFCWQTPVLGWGRVALPMLSTAGFYFLAQFLLFRLMRLAPASRVSPLLGIKIIPLAALALLLTGTKLGWPQWLSVAVCLASALVLARGGEGKLSWKALAGVFLTATAYAASDISIVRTMQAIAPEPGFRTGMFTLSLIYGICALPGLVWLLSPRMSAGRKGWPEWRGALLYSVSWYAAMVTLYTAIALIGVVPAIMLQSLRGPFSVGMGLLVAATGHRRIEKQILLRDAIKYVLAALLMCVSVALYFYR